MRKYIVSTLGVTKAYLLRFVRDKVALFFTFLFPLLFLFVFGTIFNSGDVSFKVAIINESEQAFAKQFVEEASKDETFSIDSSVTTLDDAKTKMSRGEIDSILELPKSFGAPNDNRVPSGTMNVYYQMGSEQAGQAVGAIMQNILDGINQGYGQPAPALKVAQVSTDTTGLRQFDYTFSGLLAFTILSMSIFGLANSMPQEKKSGAFRRLRASPFNAGQLILANGAYYFIITALSVIAMVVAGILLFDFDMRGSWLVFGTFASLAITMMLGFGLLIGGWAKNENQSAPLTNLIAFPMMFLSGTFFPRFLFPSWLQDVTQWLPLTPVVDGFRRIMTENANLVDLLPQLGIIVVWIVVIYALAIRLFRWE